ncbi:probable ADP-ribosylation factor GTPase-activating protein AGD15 isoform X2 [Vigna unguiculata]|uniref:probable ADP-ribosylation factor GTPase-activating protein AGD15 isoform X2 n=1 Tax=Vigna unguiculata TaxID=3917 RepID=UPI0010171187|nr:probable ADP-ribosylation factor GTPase-activating protein AGD15 isoform X2 [Vigna unguiculata]
MNGKASISKELNAKHAKILEELLKLPENRECADCRNRAPRWASVNLGIFICMQCSGIHRSLGVHISKVRSTTLDTWLPDQVSFMQCMGNVKSNKHWEAEMPLNFDRSKLAMEKFIRMKYVEKKWASKDEVHSTSNGGIPKNNRRLSLEESILANHVAQILPPITRPRGDFIDTQKKNSPPFKRPSSSVDFDKSTKSIATGDIFNLLCIYDDNQNFSTVPPSTWATFDCMINHYVSI